jgi:hypothetical protein
MARIKKFLFEVSHSPAKRWEHESYLIRKSNKWLRDEPPNFMVQDDGDGMLSVVVYVEDFDDALSSAQQRFKMYRKEVLRKK